MAKALLLEDDNDCREIITEAMLDYDVEVESYEDPTCFLKKSDKCPVDEPCVDFILTDNQMPHMIGLDFLQRLQEMECKVPVQSRAIFSGNFKADDYKRIETLGVRHFNKPYSFEKLYDWLEEIDILCR